MNKIALVTGGSRGLGKNTVLALAKQGVDVVLTYNSKHAEAEAVVAEAKALGVNAAVLQLDVGNSRGSLYLQSSCAHSCYPNGSARILIF